MIHEYVSVVVPVYNSAQSLVELTEALMKELEKVARQSEIILVDDGSKDDSAQRIRQLSKQYGMVKAIFLDGNYGQQNALMCGLRYAQGDFIITIDDDLQNPPEEMKKLLDKVEEGYDAVYGIPIEKQHTKIRNTGTWMTNMLFNAICGKPTHIKISSFRVLRRHIAAKVIEDQRSFVYLSAILLQHTKNIGNVFVEHHSRKHGSSNYNLLKLSKLFFKLLINYGILSRGRVLGQKPQYLIKEMNI